MSYRDNTTKIFDQSSTCTERSFYDLAEVLVCDPVTSNRAATRSILYSLGFRHIEIGGNLCDFLDALENRPPDLAICETQVGETELCHAIRDIRQRGQTHNPFVTIIVTTWTPSAAQTTEVLNAGANDLLARPFSAALLEQRIRAHILHQKPFIVTDDYVGPERRASERQSSALSFTPTNSLKAKMDGRANPDEAIRQFNIELRAARAELTSAKQRRAILPLLN